MTNALVDELIALSCLGGSLITLDAMEKARLSLYDWAVCGKAGVSEPISQKMSRFLALEDAQGHSSLIGGGLASARGAALFNGTTSHALDYDDTHFRHVGHLSTVVYPAALAIGEQEDLSLHDVIQAFAAGAEAAIRVGMALGSDHYNLGFHQTATAGAFGATVAVGRLLGLNQDQMRAALGLCATRASGLKSQFGTMGKPYNAGFAASNAVECATLAQLGATSAADGLEGLQGFMSTHNAAGRSETKSLEYFYLSENTYKLHACCHGTHAMIEALLTLREKFPLNAPIQEVELRTNPRWLKVCDFKAPKTGLELKFSYAWLAAMVLCGRDTSDLELFNETTVADDEIAKIAEKVRVTGVDDLSDTEADLTVVLTIGVQHSAKHDLLSPISHDELSRRLRNKGRQAVGDEEALIWASASQPDGTSARAFGNLF